MERTSEFGRVMREQEGMYDAMVRSIYGDRISLAMTVSAVAGMGMGMLFCDKMRTRMAGTLVYAMAAGVQMYLMTTPKARETRRSTSHEETAAMGASPRAA